jgi:hypothetical protein
MKFSTWLAVSPLASFAKVFAAAFLGWVMVNSQSLELHPAVTLALVSSLPVLINWLNPEHETYGRHHGAD